MEILPSGNKNCIVYLWYQIVNQAEIVINLLQTPRTNPRILAYAQILVTFDFNTTPMAPTGTKSFHMKNQINMLHGTKMEYWYGISSQCWKL